MFRHLALIFNLLAPGAGLIALRRDGLGITLALLFVLCAQIGLWGWLIVPATIPAVVTRAALAAAGLVWIAAQYLLWSRWRQAFTPGISHEIERLCREARGLIDAGSHAQAEESLLVALALNDEDVRVNALWAELMTTLGRFHSARRAWERVVQLAGNSAERRDAAAALASLP